MRPSEGTSGTRQPPKPAQRAPPSAGGLDDLRELLVGPERERLARLEAKQPLVDADSVAAFLPETVGRATEKRGEELAASLEPAVTSVVRTFARKESHIFGEILAPTIGAAVRKAVADSIAAMLQRFNETLERSFSIRSAMWRIEAARTGQSFAEVVLLHTLVYRVEQVFLIHSGTGLLLEHVRDPVAGVQDPDQVASMLEAIDAYVRESLGARTPGLHVSQIQMADLTVWVDRNPSLVLAAVVRGVAPKSFGDLLRETRERIYLAHQEELLRFVSDVTPFATSRPELEKCLRRVRRPPPRRAHYWLLAVLALLLVAIAVPVTRVIQHHRQLGAYARALEGQPGIALTSVDRAGGKVRITGFRDPLAESPEKTLARAGLAPATFRLERFHSLDPQLVERRVQRALDPPSGTMLTIENETLRATGSAPRQWIQRARLLTPALSGIERYDDSALRAQEDVAALETTALALDKVEIPFEVGDSSLIAPGAFNRAALHADRVVRAAAEARVPVCIAVTGYTDSRGSVEVNQRLSEARALRVTDALKKRGIPASLLRPRAAGVQEDRVRAVRFHSSIDHSCEEGS